MRHPGVLLLVSAVFAAGAGALAARPAAGDAIPDLPHPAQISDPRDFSGRLAQNAGCVDCHREIAEEWQGSMHQGAYTDPVFQEALAIEPFAFCRGCHAPEADPARAPGAAAEAAGVACVTCHVVDGRVTSSRGVAATATQHGVVADARFSGVLACANCHQFDFPGKPGQPMQNTVMEHAASDYADVPCQACHMPRKASKGGGSHRSHDFRVLGDPAMIAQAVRASAEREGDDALVVRLAPGVVGHSFPTGDMFRRLEVRAWTVDDAGKPLAHAGVVRLSRVFGERAREDEDGTTFFRIQVADTRVPPPAGDVSRRVRLRFDAPIADREVAWEVAYQRMENAMAASFQVNQARDEVIVARGTSKKGTR